jgi:hypothetical protein
MTSVDTEIWTDCNPNHSFRNLHGIAHGAGMFAAVGELNTTLGAKDDDVMIWSDTTRTTFAEFLHCGAFGNGVYAVGGLSGVLLTSTDAKTWSKQIIPDIVNFTGLIFGGGRFVGVAEKGGQHSTVLTSVDGTTWRKVSIAAAGALKSVCRTDNGFVAVGYGRGGIVLVSKDGLIWQHRTSSQEELHIQDVAYGNGVLIAVSLDGQVYVSTDACSWREVASSSWVKQAVEYGMGVFVVVGNEPDKVLVSTDGYHWDERPSGINAHNSKRLVGLGLCPEGFVAVGDCGLVTVSKDGFHWQAREAGIDVNMNGLIFADGRFISYGDYGAIHAWPISWLFRESLPM